MTVRRPPDLPSIFQPAFDVGGVNDVSGNRPGRRIPNYPPTSVCFIEEIANPQPQGSGNHVNGTARMAKQEPPAIAVRNAERGRPVIMRRATGGPTIPSECADAPET
jgi:hypothetical protein